MQSNWIVSRSRFEQSRPKTGFHFSASCSRVAKIALDRAARGHYDFGLDSYPHHHRRRRHRILGHRQICARPSALEPVEASGHPDLSCRHPAAVASAHRREHLAAPPTMSAEDYHPFVPAPGQSNIAGSTPRAHTEARMHSPRAQELFGTWATLAAAPFQGITTDGHVQHGLFSLAPQDAPVPAMVEAVNALLGLLTHEQRTALCLPVGSELWRYWQNTELYVEHHGLRLDETSAPIQEAVMAVLRASLSRKGYDIARGVMRLNRFLGDLVGGPAVLGEWAYTFCPFGSPSESEPWGWQLFGHHLSLNCFVIGRQMVLTPCFLGAEPSYADAGPFAGTHLFEDEERAGLKLMRSLSAGQQQQ